ncbi:MAG: type II secretion system protein GspM [Sphingorhabdus sp.]
MIPFFRTWFVNLSKREQWLVGTAFLFTAALVLVYGIILPSFSALDRARERHEEAVLRRGRIEAVVESAGGYNARTTQASSAGIDMVIRQSAAENGFDILEAGSAVAGQMTLRIDKARAPALLAWLASLENRAVEVRTIALRPNANGTVTVDVQLQQVTK